MIAPDPRPAGNLAPLVRGIDHVGVVVHDVAAEVARWRELGFLVSEPAALFSSVDGLMRPLGQTSAHVVFENGYVELSAPIAGAGNHLEPYLAAGEGVRILVYAATDIVAAHAAASRQMPGTPAPRASTRAVALPGRVAEARFQWFPLPVATLPDVLCAVVMHETPAVVFHSSLIRHPNGLTRIAWFLAGGDPAQLQSLTLPGDGGLAVMLEENPGSAALAVTGFVADGKNPPQKFRL